MESFRFTKEAIKALPLPARRTRYADTKQPGLIAAVTPGGSRVYYVFKRSRGKLHEERIGQVDLVSVDEARERARAILTDLDQGRDPAAHVARKRSGETFGDLWAWWLARYGPENPRRRREVEALYARHMASPLGLRPMSMLSRADLQMLSQRIGGAGHERTANLVIGRIRTAINRAIREGRWRGENPAADIDAYRRPSRRRVLSTDEMQRFQVALRTAKPDLRDLVLLLLYTGQRRGNVLAMRWDQVDLAIGSWTIPMTKSGRTHGVALEAEEVAILRERIEGPAGETPWVFPARKDSLSGHMTEPKNGWKALLARAGIEEFTMHDLRRTHGSWLLRSGVKLDTISKILDHSSVRVTEEVYAHLDLAPKRAAKRPAIDAMKRIT